MTADVPWLDALAVETLNEHTLAGLAVGLVRGGRLEAFTSLGMADARAGRPVDRGTVFRIGSISKTMTAIAVLQLVEEGRVGLDDPVAEHLRTVRLQPRHRSDRPVTVRHLLTHTAGIGEVRRWSDLARPVVGLAARADRPPPDLGDYYAPALRADVAPGTKWAYANHGFALLGLLVEDVRRQPFADVMRERLFAPLEMDRTDFVRTARVRDRLAVGYALRAGRMKPVKDREVAVAPAGSCYSCPDDMARYVGALVGGGPPLVRAETLDTMLQPQDAPRAGLPGMGLSFFVERVAGHRFAGHDGGWPGFASALLIAPDDGIGAFAFTNTTVGVAPHALAEKVLRRGLDVPDPEDPLVADSPHLWPELTGVYKPAPGLNTNLRWWPVIGGEVEIAVAGGRLVARAPSPLKPLRRGIRLRAADRGDPLVFEARHGDVRAPVVFERGAGGRVTALRAGSTLGGFLHLHRRPRVTSVRLWGRVGSAGTLGAAAVAIGRRRLRRRRSALGRLRRG